MLFEKVVYFFCAYWKVLTVEVLKEVVVIFQSDKASLVDVYAAEAISDVDLTQLVLSVHFQLVLKLKEVLPKLAKFHVSFKSEATLSFLAEADYFVSIFIRFQFPFNIRLEFFVFRLHQILEVLITHLLNPLTCGNRVLPHQRQFDFFVAELHIKEIAQLGLQVDLGQHKTSICSRLFVAHSFENVEDTVNAEIVLEDQFLFVDLHNSFKVDTVVEELHQGLNV